jgi:hypothetical protein
MISIIKQQSWQVWYAYWCVAWMQTAFLFGIIDERLTVPFQNTWHYQAAQLIILALSFMASKLFPLVNDTPSTNTKKGSTDNPVTFVRDLWVDTRIGSRRFTVPVELYYPVRPMATSAYEKENSKSSSTNSMPSSLLSNGNLAEWKSFYSQLTGISRHLLNHLSFIRTQSLPSTASTAADKLLPVAEIPASLPILIIPQDYNGYQVNPMRYLCEQMASDGWLVVSLQHHQMPGDSFLGELPLSPIPPYHKSNVSNTRRCPVSNDSANDGHSLFPNTATTLNVHAQTISNNNNNTNDDDGGDNNVSSEDELLQQQWDTWHRRLERRTAEISFVLDRLMAAQYGQPLSNGCSSNGSASIINSHNQPDGGANDDEEEDICIRLFKSRLDLERIAILGRTCSIIYLLILT